MLFNFTNNYNFKVQAKIGALFAKIVHCLLGHKKGYHSGPNLIKLLGAYLGP